jgi:hypothetical protein
MEGCESGSNGLLHKDERSKNSLDWNAGGIVGVSFPNAFDD